ncbi:MAG: hypothetical protein EPGJADBJ_03764 [Saprospiraceae bacterium]|nr:hypothetical protein [Saprospiraceae bacterium]
MAHSLAEQFRTFYEVFDRIQDWLDLPEGQLRFIQRRRSLIERLEKPEFAIAFLGSFNAGKSTVINALIGKDILPEHNKALTAIPTYIRKGESKPVVHYLSPEERVELYNLWVREIEHKLLLKNAPYLDAQEDPKIKFAELKRMVQDIHDPENTLKNELQQMGKLVGKWGEKYQAHTIGQEELTNYVTVKNPDIILISRVEVFVPDIDLPDDMVLVDLPGLNVANPLHKKITRDFVEGQANSFVICMKPDHLLEGEEINLLQEVYQKIPGILEGAFWVFNKWELADEQQRRQGEETFAEKMNLHEFSVMKDRQFKVSALNYLLANCIANNTLDPNSNLGKHADNLVKSGAPKGQVNAETAKRLLIETPEIANFGAFKRALQAYLEETARQEFFNRSLREWKQLLQTVLPAVERLYQRYHKEGETEQDMILDLVVEELDKIEKMLKQQIKDAVKEIRTGDGDKKNCWTKSVQEDVEKEIRRRIQNLDRKELENRLKKGLDHDTLITRIPHVVEGQLRIASLLREKLRSQIGDFILLDFAQGLLETLGGSIEMPAELNDELNRVLNQRSIYSRVEGLADALLFDYGTFVDNIGALILKGAHETGKQADSAGKKSEPDEISNTLSVYESELIQFVSGIAPKINAYAYRTIKNFAESVEMELPVLIEQHKNAFKAGIRQRANFDEGLQQEKEKREAIARAYEALAAPGVLQ